MFKLAVFIACLMLVSCQTVKNQSSVEASQSGQFSPPVENPWKVMSSAAEKEILQISYTNSIGFACVDSCMVVFETSTEYKLVAPWISGPGTIVQKHNVTGFSIKKVSKSS